MYCSDIINVGNYFGQLAQQIYQRYYRRDKTVILAEFDPNMEMGPLI